MTSGLKCTAIAILFVGLSGCHTWFGKPKPEPIQTPAPPRPAEVKPPPPKVEVPPGPPPKIDTKQPDVPAAVAVIPTPPAPKPRHKREPKKPATGTGATLNPLQNPKEGGGSAEAAAPSPVPKLGEILSDDQKLQHQKICDESLKRAREALAQLRGRSLSTDQKESVTRIKAFINQAEQSRERDPQTARQLAERADVLSRDLVRIVQ
jgi:type IV secretory pathway VirB10-like protein